MPPYTRAMRTLLFVGALSSLVGCAGSLKEHYRENYCNKDGGYDAGMKDGVHRRPREQDPASICPEAKRAEYAAGYEEGYKDGLDMPAKTDE